MLTPEERAAWLALLPRLAPGEDASEALRFVRAHQEACLAELGAEPGFDQVRAGLLRILPALVPESEARQPLLDAADAALAAFPAFDLHGAGALRRHPAWVALAAIELEALRGVEGAFDRAVALAASGFERVSPHDPHGVGELLWAIAEVAAEVGWSDRVDPLLEAAATSGFVEIENLGRVRLLQLLRLLDVDDPGASAAVDALISLVPLDPATRAHALWIGAHLDRQAGRLARAVERLETALDEVDLDEEPEVGARIRAALRAWGADAATPAQA